MPRQATDIQVPIEPFSRWLRWMRLVNGDYYKVASAIGYNATTVAHWAQGWRPTAGREKNFNTTGRVVITEIGLRHVDKALTNADMDETIWSLYPDLDLDFDVAA